MSDCLAPHKTLKDHSVIGEGGVRIWRCSHCGKRAPWAVGEWSYFGTMECARGAYGTRGCGYAVIDFVACSDRCAEALKR